MQKFWRLSSWTVSQRQRHGKAEGVVLQVGEVWWERVSWQEWPGTRMLSLCSKERACQNRHTWTVGTGMRTPVEGWEPLASSQRQLGTGVRTRQELFSQFSGVAHCFTSTVECVRKIRLQFRLRLRLRFWLQYYIKLEYRWNCSTWTRRSSKWSQTRLVWGQPGLHESLFQK